MKKSQIIENPSKFTAVNAFIFAGSFSIGTMKAGFDLKKVLEISDSQPEQNAFYFKKNVEDVPVILPSQWENDDYLDGLKKEKIDLMCCNCPCSSLSQINRNASVDGKNNVHFYRLFNVFKHVQPRVFVIENAPTLVKLGFPILRDMVDQLGDKYRFTIVRDHAGNHQVPMFRQRTLVIGWRRDAFKNHPLINEDIHKKMTVKDTLSDMYSDTTNDNPSKDVDSISDLYKYADPKMSFITSLAKRYIKDENGFKSMLTKRLSKTNFMKEVLRIVDKIINKQNWWDKTPVKLSDDDCFPSLTSVNEYLHPHQDRTLNLRETARIMNYPDWYDFSDPKKECKIPVMQAIAQGVPANFGKYVALQVRLGLEGKLKTLDDSDSFDIVFQNHSRHMFQKFTKNEFNSLTCLEITSGSKI